MRLPCEIIIIDILPIIRKELAIELVKMHGISKARVARIFQVSGTAISQYIHGTRGNSSMIEDTPQYEQLLHEIYSSAEKIASRKKSVMEELCRLCDFVKSTGIVNHVYMKDLGEVPVLKCIECPKDNSSAALLERS
ncbi:MAG: transcriptional regulator [Methanomassiliicoccaceae archaeon]|nr:transcriptional regulator [Methanomassiliicoccaceae archaeon]